MENLHAENQAGKRLARFEVTGLFGWLHHVIDLRTDERITILHGPNGVGKTTVLNLIVAVFRSDYRYLRRCKFDSVIATTLDGASLHAMHEGKRLRLTLRFPGGEVESHLVDHLGVRRHPTSRLLSILDDVVPWLDRVGPREFHDRKAGDTIRYEEALERYEDQLPAGYRPEINTVPASIQDFVKGFAVHFIETQRLLAIPDEPRRYDRGRLPPMVEEHAQNMAQRVQEVLRLFATQTASLDRTFPQRLLRERVPHNATEGALRQKYEAQNEYRARLMSAGLLDSAEQVDLSNEQLEDSDFRVLWHYLNDTEAKFSVFHDLLARVELFLGIINGKKFLRKTLKIDKDEGYRFVWDHGDSMNTEETVIPLSALSSGEQHELVLAYHLLFEAKPNTLILVDEPELSLHVTWQHAFLDDLQRISSLATLDFLIATHSPAIVGRRSSLMVELASE